ncbi:hypothetical protein D3C71_314380 [compost metagenome]
MTPLQRLLTGYYNSGVVSEANPGGFADGGHVVNFPAALADLGAVADGIVLDADAIAGAGEKAAQAAASAEAAGAARDEASLIASGRTVRSGEGSPPAGLGRDGDFYIDRLGYWIYGPKAAGAWGSRTSMAGPDLAALIEVVDGKASQEDLTLLATALNALAQEVEGISLPQAATASELRAGSDATRFGTAKGMADAVATAIITPAVAAIGMDFSGFINAEITLTANLTLGVPSGGFARKTGEIDIVMNATGGWALAFHANYIVPATFALQATPNGRTSIPYRYQSDGKVRLYSPSKWVA